MKKVLIFVALLAQFLVSTSFASDYAREKRWAEEVVPGVIVGEAIYLKQANGHEFLALYTPAKEAKHAVIVVHGLGIHPDWGLIGVLRTELADAGYTTLSIQMPVLKNEAKSEEYPSTFPEAKERLKLAVDFLKGKGYDRIAIVSHSMGSWMSYEYLSDHPDPAVKDWVAMGLAARTDLGKIHIPMLDMYGEKDFPDVLANAKLRKKTLEGKAGSMQEMIPKADHFYTGLDNEMVSAVKNYLDANFRK